VCVCAIHTHTRTHINTHQHTHIFTHTYTRTHARMHARTHAREHTPHNHTLRFLALCCCLHKQFFVFVCIFCRLRFLSYMHARTHYHTRTHAHTHTHHLPHIAIVHSIVKSYDMYPPPHMTCILLLIHTHTPSASHRRRSSSSLAKLLLAPV
jgi:hypothetical protein